MTTLLDRSAYIITHRDNLAWIVAAGVVGPPSAQLTAQQIDIWDPHFTAIRHRKTLPFPPQTQRTLRSCVGLNFTTKTPALLNLMTSQKLRHHASELVIFRTTPRLLTEHLIPFLVFDRIPIAAETQCGVGAAALDLVNWQIIDSGDFSARSDRTRPQRMGAELVATESIPVSAIDKVIVFDDRDAVHASIKLATTNWKPQITQEPNCFFVTKPQPS